MPEQKQKSASRLLGMLLAVLSLDRLIALAVAVSLTAAVSTPLAATAIEAKREQERVAALPSNIVTSIGNVSLSDDRFPEAPAPAAADDDGSSIEIALDAPGVDGDAVDESSSGGGFVAGGVPAITSGSPSATGLSQAGSPASPRPSPKNGPAPTGPSTFAATCTWARSQISSRWTSSLANTD